MSPDISYKFRDCIELQLLDCNCNNCSYMERDFDRYNYWKEWHRDIELQLFNEAKDKAIQEAQSVINNACNDENKLNTGKGLLRVANKMTFQFDASHLLHYGFCHKFERQISFIPNTCQIETQSCFKHRNT